MDTLNIVLALIFLMLGVATVIHLTREYRLRKLQKKRDKCDLSTKQGRMQRDVYNQKINNLMNYAPTKGE